MNKNPKIILLEGLAKTATQNFEKLGFSNVLNYSQSFEGDELIEKIKDAEIIWIRSNTFITKEVLDKLPNLKAIGCFCVGTDQVDLEECMKRKIKVFNAPFWNNNSVAELIIGYIIILSRRVFEKNIETHSWIWDKTAQNSFEIKWKTLWIIGYWNIWKLLSILAENIWMNVIFYDPFPVEWVWKAIKKNTQNELLKQADFVSLHVPDIPSTRNMISDKEFDIMKKWSYLINLSRWKVVNINDLKKNLESGKILWAALDVFPEEPNSKNEKFISPLQWMYNVIMTPHIGWSTIEAQNNIWIEVSEKLSTYYIKNNEQFWKNIF